MPLPTLIPPPAPTARLCRSVLFGGSGSDVVLGDQGDDSVNGQGGSNTISGGQGDDTLIGAISEINENYVLSAALLAALNAT